MWMTSSSRADVRPAILSLLVLCQVSCVAPADPDNPEPADPTRLPQPTVQVQSQRIAPVELRSAEVRKMDPAMAKLAGSEFMERARDPLVIDVQVTKPLDPTPRASYPLILWNERKLSRTVVMPEQSDRLVAFLPDRSSVLEENTVAVVWAGNEMETRTRRPITIPAGEVGR